MRILFLLLGLIATPLIAAERVVSLAPSLSEIMLELDAGSLLVGVLDGGERPAALAGVPSVGRYGQVEMETLLSLRPDLVLLWPGSVSAAQRQQLRDFGLEVIELLPHRLADLAHQVERVGEAIGRQELAARRASELRDRLERLAERYARDEPLQVFYQVWDQPLYTVGGQQIISDALRLCGARNVFEALTLPAPQVGIEAVLARDPQIIVTSLPRLVESWRRWPQLQAVRTGQVWAVPDRGLERPSLQMLDATEALCARLQPDR